MAGRYMKALSIVALLLMLSWTFVLGEEFLIEFNVQEEQDEIVEVGYIGDSLNNPNLQPPYQQPPIENTLAESYFKIDYATGQITTKRKLDRETKSFYVFLVMKGDSGIRINVTVLDINDNRPTFTNSTKYLRIAENAPHHKVSLGSAVDRDVGVNSISEDYRIVSGNIDHAFNVTGRKSGEHILLLDLGINGTLDYETTQFYSLLVEVYDGGTPRKTGQMTVDISIEDSNDNHPVFSHSKYSAQVPENASIGDIVLRVHATDQDSGFNGQVFYSIQSSSNPGTHFVINETSGEISINKLLDYEANQFFGLIIYATDNGTTKTQSSAYVRIDVVNVNEKPAKIDLVFLTNETKIRENATIGEIVARISVSDPDVPNVYNPNISVTIQGGNGDFGLTTADNVVYFMEVKRKLDRETIPEYNITLIATDSGSPPLSVRKSFTLFVSDVNDNSPKFSETQYHATVEEMSSEGSSVLQVSATDPDEGENQRIQFYIEENNPTHSDWFTVNENSGLITTLGQVDCEIDPEPSFMVIAKDNGVPPRSSSVLVMVTVLDVNDKEPMFDTSLYLAEVREDQPLNSVILQVRATDPDCGVNGQIRYFLSNQSTEVSATFRVDINSGNISLNKNLDHESPYKRYEFPVTAMDNGNFETTANVQITVLDVNDNYPIFYPHNYSKNIQENQATNVEIITVHASDIDSGVFGKVTYQILSGNENGRFKINSTTGAISLTQSLPAGERLYVLKIDAVDGAGLRTKKPAEVHISVTGPNYNPPQFERPMYRFQIREDVARDTPVGSVTATYSVTGAVIRYSITDGDRNSFFRINQQGEIFTDKALDHDEYPSLLLNIMADVSQNPPIYGTTQVNITVEDVNDNAPEFSSTYITTSVSEDITPNIVIYVAHATDKDSRANGNGEVKYRLLGNPFGLFVIDELSGEIHLREGRSLDYETLQSYELVVNAYDQGSNISLSSNMTLGIKVQDSNDNSPIFDRLVYIVNVSEVSPATHKVVQVNATDRDGGENGRITYGLQQSEFSNVFGIFPNDGYVYLKEKLDREERDQYILTVIARDHGQPSNTASVQVTIHVEDYNDNAPYFSQNSYTMYIEENLNSDTVVGHVMADDIDFGINAALSYSFQTTGHPFVVLLDGTIKTTTSLNREATPEYDLTVRVTDLGVPPKDATCKVNIFVMDVNDNPPYLTNSEFVAFVDENRAKGIRVVQMTAEDLDAGENGMVTFSLTEGEDDALSHFTIHPKNGWITTKEVLDYEDKSSYRFKVKVTDGGSPPLSSEHLFEVQVRDDNDERPIFQVTVNETYYVVENTPTGTTIGQVEAYDKDGGENGRVSYYITGGNHFGLFSVESSTGDIVTIRDIDFEESSFHLVEIKAVDNSVYNPKSSMITIRINILDINDNPPVFEIDPVFLSIRENRALGTMIYAFTATDADSDVNGTVRYEIINSSVDIFQIDTNTGHLTVGKTVDYEQVKDISLIIRAYDSGPVAGRLYTNLTVMILVLDENDNAPVFQDLDWGDQLQVSEDEKIGYQIASVIAVDADSNVNNSRNNVVVYSIVSGNLGEAFNLHVNEGILSVAADLDRETVPSYTLRIMARDQGSPSQTSQIQLTIQILDVNDNAPHFLHSTYQANVTEGSTSGTFVVKIEAVDLDEGLNGKLTYTIPEGIADNQFRIDPENGEITTRLDTLDRELKSSYILTAYVQDSGNPIQYDMATIIINITDINDQSPVFKDEQYLLQIPENKRQESIHTFVAFDADIGVNARVTYSIISGNVGSEFSIEPNLGVLSCVELDRERVDIYNLIIGATDGKHSTQCTVMILVLDQNDNDPVFEQPSYTAVLFENASPGSHVVTVRATDQDEGDSGKVTYALGSGSETGLFRINNITGNITTSGTFDWEKQNEYSFDVVASDGGQYDRRTERVRVDVRIGDINDNAPVFQKLPYKKMIGQGAVKDQHVLKVIAEDKDDGQNGEVRYSFVTETEWFKIDTVSGDIFVTKSLDADALGYHNLKIRAEDQGTPTHLSSTGVVEITVGPSQNQPHFQSENYTATIKEHASRGTQVVTVELVSSSSVSPDFSFASGNDGNAFQINSQGEITVSDPGPIDHEESPTMRLIVVAKTSSFFAYTTVWITLIDINDQRPTFTQDRYVTKVYEELAKHTYVTQVTATDGDSFGPNREITYNIIQGNDDEAFTIFPAFSGIIKTNVIIDYEIQNVYRLVIEARDNGNKTLSSTCVVKISVIDTNDNFPKFPKTSPVNASEATEVGTVIVRVTANDVDTSPAVTYNFTSNPDDMFSIDRYSGEIRLARPLDHEYRQQYTVGLEASDSVHKDYTSLTVYVSDENDNQPQFSQNSYQVTLKELTPPNSKVVQVNASDADSGPNAHITYNLAVSPSLGFYIDQTTGEIFTNETVQYDPSQQIIQLVVTATDGGSPALSGVVVVHIQVTSVNRHHPEFDQNSYYSTLLENSERGVLIALVSATDADSGTGPNQKIDYYILNGNHGNMFSIDQKHGRIILNGDLDYETTKEYNLLVMAEDRGLPPLNNTVIVQILVQDVNDMVPYFDHVEFTVNLSESYQSEQVFHVVHASDDDTGVNAKLYYTITSGNEDGLFIVNGGTGDMVVMPNMELDYERQTTHKLVVRATDCTGCEEGIPRLSNVTTVIVNVEDVNEFRPEFPVYTYVAGLLEDMEMGSPVFEAHANDKDGGEFGVVHYSMRESAEFEVHYSTGLVTSKKKFDYETAAQRQFRFNITATDTGGLKTSVSVLVNLKDKDEYPPVFITTSYNFTARGSDVNGTVVGIVKALDDDGGDAGRIFYKISPADHYFGMNAGTGEIKVIYDLNKPIITSRRKRELTAGDGFQWLSSYIESHNHRMKRDVSVEKKRLQIEASSGMDDSLKTSIVVEIEIDRSCPDCQIRPIVVPPGSTPTTPVSTAVIVIIVISIIAVALTAVIVIICLRSRFIGKSPPPSEMPVYNSDEFDTLPSHSHSHGPPPYRDIIRFGGVNSANVTSSSDMSNQSHNSGSSGRGSAEDEEDEEIRMITSGSPYLNNSNGFRKAMPDSGIQDDDNTSEPSVQNHQDYLARLGIDTAKINSKAKSGLAHSVESMHQFSDSGGGEGTGMDIGVDYTKLGNDHLDNEVAMLDKSNDLGFHEPEPHMQGSLSNVINSEEEYSGSYNWDYLLDWGPQYQPLAHVFAEIARLKDDTIQPKKQPVQIVQQRQNSMNPQVRTVPPPMITNAPPKVIMQPQTRSGRSSHSSGSQANSARTSTMNTSLPSMPRSPISHESSFTSPALTPSFTPSLSPLATRSPSVSPVSSGRGLMSSNHSSGQNTPRGRSNNNNNKYGFSSSSSEQELRI